MIAKRVCLTVAGVLAWAFVAVFPVLGQESVITPAYYRVAGVAGNDVLNVRQSPNASAPVVGSLAPDAFPVEVIKTRDGWGYVAANEGMGWVSLRFLQQISFAKFANTNLPEGLSCGGVEPFWGLVMANDNVTFSAMDEPERVYSLVGSGQSRNFGTSTSFVIGQNNGEPLTGIVSDQICSDGMSDIDYGRRIDVLLSGSGGTTALGGCCQISVQQ